MNVVRYQRHLHGRRSDRGDVLYTIGGPETFRQLVGERAWTPARYERWLVEAAEQLPLAK